MLSWTRRSRGAWSWPDEIDTLATRVRQIGRAKAFEEWIDAQMALPATYHKPIMTAMIMPNRMPVGR